MNRQPLCALLSKSAHQQSSLANLQCRRSVYNVSSPAVVFALQCRQWHHHTPNARHSISSSPRRLARFASTSSAAAAKPTSTTTPAPAKYSSKLTDLHRTSKLNPPPESYAPEVNLPTRGPNQSWIGYLWQCGRAYIGFYKTATTNVRSTARLAKTLRQKAAASTGDKTEIWTRAEWQLVNRSRRDMLRLPAFAVLILLTGEWLPIIALYITPVIPEPCRIPKQVERTLKKSEARRKERQRRLALDAARLIQQDRQPGVEQTSPKAISPRKFTPEDVKGLDLYTLLNLSARLDAHSRVWEMVFLTPPKALLRWSVGRKLAYLHKDDSLIERDGGWQGLGKQEVHRACVERGIDVLGKSDSEMRDGLAQWYGFKRR